MMSLIIKSMIIAAVIFGIWEIIQIIIGLWVWSTVRKDVSEAKYEEIMNMNNDDMRNFLVQHFSENLKK